MNLTLDRLILRREACFREHKWVKSRWRSSLVYAVPKTNGLQ